MVTEGGTLRRDNYPRVSLPRDNTNRATLIQHDNHFFISGTDLFVPLTFFHNVEKETSGLL